MDTKTCETCGATFAKPRTCGRPEWSTRRFCGQTCKAASQRGKSTWNAGITKTTAPQLSRTGRRRKHPPIHCAICGSLVASANRRLRTCGSERCRAEYATTKRANIVTAAKATYANGRKSPGVFGPRVSRHEEMIANKLTALGWIPQVIVRTGDSSKFYRLDFAIPERRLYVEIDGRIHERMNKPAHDAKRTQTLSRLGWRGIRFANLAVEHDPSSVVDYVTAFMQQHW